MADKKLGFGGLAATNGARSFADKGEAAPEGRLGAIYRRLLKGGKL